MSVFSIIKKSRQQAREHSQKEADKAKKEAEHKPYRHVPTHAAVDALSVGPAGCNQEDRNKIIEQNHRRSAIASTAQPSACANLTGDRLPRSYSYHGVPPSWDRDGHVNYHATDMAASSSTHRSKRVTRPPMLETRQSLSSSSKGSPAHSSSDSISSQEELQMRPTYRRRTTMPSTSVGTSPLHHTPIGRPAAHRLHPSSRSNSDVSVRSDSASLPRFGAGSPSSRRPPPSMLTRGFGSMPQFAPPLVQLPEPVADEPDTAAANQQQTLGSLTFDLPPSAPTLTPSPETPGASASLLPGAAASSETVGQDKSFSTPGPMSATPHNHAEPRKTSVSGTRIAHFTELSTIDSIVPPASSAPVGPPAVSDEEISEAPEARASQASEALSISSKGRRLSKQPRGDAKPARSNRWSFRGNATVAA